MTRANQHPDLSITCATSIVRITPKLRMSPHNSLKSITPFSSSSISLHIASSLSSEGICNSSRLSRTRSSPRKGGWPVLRLKERVQERS